MTTTIQDPWLRKQFEVLCGAYTYPENAGQYAAWETWLLEYPRWAISQVVKGAVDRWNKMPEVGTLRLAIVEVIQRRQNQEREAEAKKNPTDEPQPAYTGNPKFLELALRWEREDRDDPTHESRGPQRAAELNALWAAESTITVDGKPMELPIKHLEGSK